MPKYPAPGRGAWRLAGGPLPAKPGSKGTVGYYRAATGSEAPIGSAWLKDEEASHDAYCVHLGVKAIQKLVGVTIDGWFGPQTAKACTSAQAGAGVEADGVIGPVSMRAFLTPLIIDMATHNNVPLAILGGLLVNESSLDPAAVGTNGQDHGLAQINLGAHPSVTVERALNPDFAILFAAEDLMDNHRRWVGHTKADPWDVAIACHNSPALGRDWAISGVAPVVPGRVFQIADYVAKVKAAW